MIPLTKNLFATVDEADYELVSKYKWHAVTHPEPCTSYAARRGAKGESRVVYMHRQITGFKMVDHANHDGLDNTRANLRECTHSQNACNTSAGRKNRTGFRGVQFHPTRKINPYQATVVMNGKLRHVGNYATAELAARARDAAAKNNYGEFASTNF